MVAETAVCQIYGLLCPQAKGSLSIWLQIPEAIFLGVTLFACLTYIHIKKAAMRLYVYKSYIFRYMYSHIKRSYAVLGI